MSKIFRLDKLVRSNLAGPNGEYAKNGQKAEYRELESDEEIREALIAKMEEEIMELKSLKPGESPKGEIADIQQALYDYADFCGINGHEVDEAYKSKRSKMGYFVLKQEGEVCYWYVDTLELADDDPWVDYYREEPDSFPELEDEK